MGQTIQPVTCSWGQFNRERPFRKRSFGAGTSLQSRSVFAALLIGHVGTRSNSGSKRVSAGSLLITPGLPKELNADIKRTEWKWQECKKENHGFPRRTSIGGRKRRDGTH